MTIDYFPLDFRKIDKFFEENNYYYNNKEKEEKLFELFDSRFCNYIGKDGLICGRKSRIIIKENCCKQHLKKLEKYNPKIKEIKENQKKRIRKKDIIYKCISLNKNGKKCQRNVLGPNVKCNYHKSSKLTNYDKKENDILLVYKDYKDNNTRRKERIKNFDINYIEKYRNMEILSYLTFYCFDIKNDGIRKKVKKGNLYFTVNTKSNLFIDNNNSKIYGKGLLNLIIYLLY
jgi:hypothetical protein